MCSSGAQAINKRRKHHQRIMVIIIGMNSVAKIGGAPAASA